MSDTRTDLINHAKSSVPELTADETKQRLDAGEVDLILDVREPSEWDAGHIPGALHAPRGLLEWYADPEYENHKPDLAQAREKTVVVHCALGGRSLLAAETLKRLGFRNVYSMAGGYTDWTAKGYPTEKRETNG